MNKKMEKLEKKKAKLETKALAAQAKKEEKEENDKIKRENKKKSKKKTLTEMSDEGSDDLFDTARKSVKERIAPDGINPNPLEYMIINDQGQKAYVSVFYIYKLPRTDTFVTTFAELFNYPGVTSNVYMEPVSPSRARKSLNKRVLVLDTERRAAVNDGDINRQREITEKLADVESWARAVETGSNSIFSVGFIHTISSLTLKGLNATASAFCSLAREKGIEMSNAYSLVPEAYLCGAPLVKIYNFRNGPFSESVIKKHIMDKRSLANIFNHTRADFSHENGVILGRNMHTGRPVFFDVFERSNNGYAIVIAGKVGTGKSVTVKVLASRYIDFGAKIVCIDYDSNGNMGEYCQITHEVGGVNYQIKSHTKTILNLFEVEAEMKFDEIAQKEYESFNLQDKITDMSNIIITIIKAGKSETDFATDTFLRDKVSDLVSALYAERGIVDQEIDSLYQTGQVLEGGHLVSGRVKKKLPTITDFVYKAIVEQKNNKDHTYDMAYSLIIAGMKNYVRELYYCIDTLKKFTKEEYEAMKKDEQGVYYMANGERHNVMAIKGIKTYFDGESNIVLDTETSMINFDISQLPEPDKPVAQQVVMNFTNEHFIKNNSSDPSKVQDRIIIVDEAHRMFPYAEARKFMADVYRTARKKHVSPWTITQALADYSQWDDTKTMAKQAACKLLLKQDYQDADYIKKQTPLSDYQVRELLSLGGDPGGVEFLDEEYKNARRGEVCLIVGDRVQFVKVDRLMSSEARFTETDATIRQKLFAKLKG